MRRIILYTLTMILVASVVNAQEYFGISTSNWSGTNSLYLNPANIADNRARFTVDVLSLNLGINSDLGTINSSNVMKKFFSGDSVNINDVFKLSGNTKQFNMLAPYGEVRGPGVMVSINHRHSLALTTRIRASNQFNNFDQSLYQTITDPNFTANSDYSLTSRNFNWTGQMWSEIGLSYGVVLLEKGKSQLKAGVTIRYLGGIGYVGLKGNNLDAQFFNSNDSVRLTNTDLQYSSNIIKTENELSSGIGNADLFSRFFGAKGGSGVGGDIGIVYEYRPDYPKQYTYDMDGKTGLIDYTQNMYKFRISAAVTDIGAITYKNAFVANLRGNGYLSGNEIGSGNFQNFTDFSNYAKSHGFTVDTGTTNEKIYLPTSLIIGFDYHIAKAFYINATYVGNLVSHQNFGTTMYDQITVTPRYDTRLISVGLPITYNSLSSDIKVGLGARVSGFFIGSDDMLALFSNSQYGFNFYVGGFVPINKRKPRDRDHDGVSDKKDLCPTEPGYITALGCPDKDHDGVQDKDDRCPSDSGVVELQGCPDRDDDGIADIDDECPDQAGLYQFHGCPDTDNDGVADKDDACPDKAGLPRFQGCPDTDHDDVPDNEDACPDVPGSKMFHGCPDSDGDGVGDNEDRCPTKAGPISNHGCPVIKAEVKKRLAFAATAIQFETGKAKIKKTSYPLLNEIVKILNDYPDYYMTIDGYTDNVGKPETNLQLSKDRAQSVKNYFVSQGIPENKIVANGHGEADPVASNKTAKGRAKNRRVAMDLKLKE